MFFRQLVPLKNAMKVACHMTASEDDPDVEVESTEWEENTAYPVNTIVWYNGTAYVSVHPVPDNAESPDKEPDFWGWLMIN